VGRSIELCVTEQGDRMRVEQFHQLGKVGEVIV
jgi:hypothetical protein